jgi:hypothetical protein
VRGSGLGVDLGASLDDEHDGQAGVNAKMRSKKSWSVVIRIG